MCLPLENLDSRTLAQGEHCGFMWQIVANHMATRCGYIRVEPGHPWFAKSYNDVDCKVHGGLTFGAPGTACATHDEKAEYWYGFDCGHAFDAPDPSIAFGDEAKAYIRIREESRAEYPDRQDVVPEWMRETIKDTAYVERECRKLCEQAQAAMKAQAA